LPLLVKRGNLRSMYASASMTVSNGGDQPVAPDPVLA
jgi:hypothetical protein